MHRMVLEKLADGKAVTEEEMDLLLDLVGPEVGPEHEKSLCSTFLIANSVEVIFHQLQIRVRFKCSKS